MNDIKINWKEYFDNECKGEDLWGHYKTANGDLYVVTDGASSHEFSKTGADVVRVYAETERRIHSSHEDLLTGLVRSG